MNEQVVTLGESNSRFGILTEPTGESPTRSCGVLLLSAGLLHRVGPNRLYVTLARRLAASGFTSLRFDFSGVGDSPLRPDTLPFHEYAVAETQEAMRSLAASAGIERFILMGLCSGADTAVRTARVEPRVLGIIPLNWPGRKPPTDMTEAHERAPIHRLLLEPRSWRRFLTGKSGYRRIVHILKAKLSARLKPKNSARAEAEMEYDWRSIAQHGVHMLFVYSAADNGLRFFKKTYEPRIRRLKADERLGIEVVPNADHSFTLLQNHEHVIPLIDAWARGIPMSS